MNYYEMLKCSAEILERLHNAGAKIDDHKYLPLFEEFCQMTADGEKVTYIALHLAQKYGVSERQVYYIVRRSSSEIAARNVQLLSPSTKQV